MTNAEARFSKSLRPRKPEGSLGRTAQDVHLDSHTAPELYRTLSTMFTYYNSSLMWMGLSACRLVLSLSTPRASFPASSSWREVVVNQCLEWVPLAGCARSVSSKASAKKKEEKKGGKLVAHTIRVTSFSGLTSRSPTVPGLLFPHPLGCRPPPLPLW